MERDFSFNEVKKWRSDVSGRNHLDKAFQYLSDVVRNLFMKQVQGVPLDMVPRFMAENKITEDMVKSIGFDSHAHFLFHLDDILEIRGKKLNGRIFYFLFVNEIIRRGIAGLTDDDNDDGAAESWVGMRCYHSNTFPASYSKVLNLHRDNVIPPVVDADFSVRVKTAAEWKEERNKKKISNKKAGTVLGSGNKGSGESLDGINSTKAKDSSRRVCFVDL